MAIAIYSIALAYLVVVGFASVIPQVFWPAADDSFDLDCGDGLQLLEHEIEELRLTYLSSAHTDPTTLRDTLVAWDLRLNALARKCDEEPVELLRRYRYRVELNLQRYMREDAPLAERVRESLEPSANRTNNERAEPTP